MKESKRREFGYWILVKYFAEDPCFADPSQFPERTIEERTKVMADELGIEFSEAKQLRKEFLQDVLEKRKDDSCEEREDLITCVPVALKKLFAFPF